LKSAGLKRQGVGCSPYPWSLAVFFFTTNKSSNLKMTKDDKPARTLLGVETEYLQEGDRVTFKNTQNITPAFMDDLRDSRNASTETREKDFQRVASIPVVVHEQWLREGFDLYKASVKEITKRLRDQSLDYFMATDKRN
jgi:hypothetical protein